MQPKREMHSLSVKSGDRILLIPLTEVSHFVAEDKYVFLNTLDGQQYLVSQTLTSLEEKLPAQFSAREPLGNSQYPPNQPKYNATSTESTCSRCATARVLRCTSGSTYGEAVRQLLSV